MIYIDPSDGFTASVKTFKFSGGEVQVRLENTRESYASATILANLRSSDDIMELLMVTDAIRRIHPDVKLDLVCPYLPYARQDRVVYPGEALSIAVMCKLINSQNYNKVVVWDAHSDVSLALLDRVVHREAWTFVRNIKEKFHAVIAPDVGAVKRAKAVADYLKVPLYTAEKTRDPNNGQITGTKINLDDEHCLEDKDVLIVDDICDGGRTFIELAKVLRNYCTNDINLYVTHGIFSKGFDELGLEIDRIYVANSFVAQQDIPDVTFVTFV